MSETELVFAYTYEGNHHSHTGTAMIRIRPRPGSNISRFYENLVPVGQPRFANDNTNTDQASNQLVQFFLKMFFGRRPELTPRTAAGTPVFLLDGQVGTQTIKGIKIFQDFTLRNGNPLINDSRVSVAIGNTVPGTATFWTIHAMNGQFVLDFGKEQFETLSFNPVLATVAPQLTLELLQEEQLLAAAP